MHNAPSITILHTKVYLKKRKSREREEKIMSTRDGGRKESRESRKKLGHE